MKKYFLILIFILSFNFIRGQITITSSDLPQIGETYLISTDTTPSILLGTPSASSQVWNFSSLTQDYPSFPTYGATALTPHAAAFSMSNLYTYGPAALYGSFYGSAPVGTQGMNKGYMFWKTDVSGFWVVGFRADSGTYANTNVFENPMELLIGTPATYASSFNNIGRWVLPMNLNPLDVDTFYVNRVTKTLTTDAWGSITTPTGIFPNVIRIHEYEIKVDSVYSKIGATTVFSMELLRDTLNNYIYMANGVHYPVCIVRADKNKVVKTVEYYNATFLDINENLSELSATAFPNPFSTNCTIVIPQEFSNHDATLSLFDISGRSVFNCSLKSNSIIIDSENYKEGIYFYLIQNSTGEKIKGKLLIVK